MVEKGRGEMVMNFTNAIGEPAMLEQLAEECIELAHACLKLARVERGESPTPVTLDEARRKVVEEMADMSVPQAAIWDTDWFDVLMFDEVVRTKTGRFEERLVE